jgi:hypothetical protein
MKTYYKDSYGHTASIEGHRNGTATLRLVSSVGKRTKKEYDTVRGAKCAMGKYSDCWRNQ